MGESLASTGVGTTGMFCKFSALGRFMALLFHWHRCIDSFVSFLYFSELRCFHTCSQMYFLYSLLLSGSFFFLSLNAFCLAVLLNLGFAI